MVSSTKQPKSEKELPTVAIVGRPNVGKSTLFNRFAQKRLAIVDDRPGVTRDRNAGVIEWCGTFFRLLDTGGYLPGDDDEFIAGIREQIQLAVREADVLLLVFDAQDGVSPIDEEFVQIVLKSGKPTVVAVNKIDSGKLDAALYDFYKLGLGEPLPVSAEGGRGVGDLLDRIVGLIPKKQFEPEQEKVVHLAIVGKPNVGKSSFVNALIKENKVLVSDIPGTTRDAIDSHFRFYGYDFVLIDTAGLRKKSQINDNVEYYSTVRTMRSIDRADVTVVLIDAEEGLTHQDKRVITEVEKRKKGLIIAVNKWDLVKKDDKTMAHYEKKVHDALGNLDYIPIIMISCLHNLRLRQVVQVALSVYKERRKRIATATINDKLGKILRDKPPLIKDARPIKVHYLTQVGTEPPTFALFTNRPQAIAVNYKRFLERKIREQFGFFGAPISFLVRKK